VIFLEGASFENKVHARLDLLIVGNRRSAAERPEPELQKAPQHTAR